MPARSNRPRKLRPKSQHPAQKRTMWASGLSRMRSSRLRPALRKGADARKTPIRPLRALNTNEVYRAIQRTLGQMTHWNYIRYADKERVFKALVNSGFKVESVREIDRMF